MTACVGPAWCSASPQRGSTRSSTRSRCPAWHRRPPEPLGGAHPPRDWTAGQARTDTDAMRRLLARLLQPLEATVVLVFYCLLGLLPATASSAIAEIGRAHV